MEYKIKDLLELPSLSEVSKTILNEALLDRDVSWVHIMEVQRHIDDLLDGNELILTTGIGLPDKQSVSEFLQHLSDSNIACLAIEVLPENAQIASWMTELAGNLPFPIIIIQEIVRFIDITRECNTLIISRNNQLETYTTKVKEIDDARGLEAILDFTANYCDLQVIFQPLTGKNHCTDAAAYRKLKEHLQTSQDSGASDFPSPDRHILSTSVVVWNRSFGMLSIFSIKREMTPNDALVLSKIAARICQHIIFDLKNQEKTVYQWHKWIMDWLTNKMPDQLLRPELTKHGVKFKKYHCLVCIASPDDSEVIPLPDSLIIDNFSNIAIEEAQTYFHNYELMMLGVVQDNEQIFCIIAPDSIHDIEKRTEKALHDIQKRNSNAGSTSLFRYAIGPAVNRYEDMGASYRKAQRSMEILKKRDQYIGFYSQFYDKLVFDLLNNDGLLTEYATDVLGPILLPENKELLKTLMIFYDCNCSKQKTAEQLFIARQTMYFRLQKIEALLGEGFDQGERRFGLEMAVRIQFYLSDID